MIIPYPEYFISYLDENGVNRYIKTNDTTTLNIATITKLLDERGIAYDIYYCRVSMPSVRHLTDIKRGLM